MKDQRKTPNKGIRDDSLWGDDAIWLPIFVDKSGIWLYPNPEVRFVTAWTQSTHFHPSSSLQGQKLLNLFEKSATHFTTINNNNSTCFW